MTEPAPDVVPDPASAPRKRLFRRWLTIGEVVGVGALVIALLGYLDAHRERVVQHAAQAERQAAQSALVLRGSADADGARVTLSPVNAEQVVQSQRYLFPHAVLDHAMEVSAAQPQIDRGWFEGGLRSALAARGATGEGEAQLPVGIETTYVEDGRTRTDRSLYRVGYKRMKGGLFGGGKIVLQGVSLARRNLSGDVAAAVEQAWRAAPGPQG